MIDAAERALLEESVRTAFARASGGEGGSIDSALAELGWLDLLRDEPSDAVAVVFRELGATNTTATALDDVLSAALGRAPCADAAILLPALGSAALPGRRTGDRLRATGFGTARADSAAELIVASDAAGGPTLSVVPMAAARVEPVGGLDPAGQLRVVTVDVATAETKPLVPEAWESALALGRRAIAYEIAGACRAMLELAQKHALERVQFGQPIARFQAVRTRLADALVAVEALDAALVTAALEPGAATAALAKAAAGRTARTVSAQCQQVLAGIGFTTEHAFHRYLKRTMSREGLFGSADGIVLSWGRHLLETGAIPRLIEL